MDAVQDRLKPPVSAINMEHKVIKLSGSKNASSSSSFNDREHVQSIHKFKQPSASESVATTGGSVSIQSASLSRNINLGQHASITEKTQLHQTLATKMSPVKRSAVDTGESEKKKFKATAITWP